MVVGDLKCTRTVLSCSKHLQYRQLEVKKKNLGLNPNLLDVPYSADETDGGGGVQITGARLS